MKEISLCVIVKNEEKNINSFLESVKVFVDEVIIVDTGSTDKTLDIIKEFIKNDDKIKIFVFDKKLDGLSEPRNFSLDKATKDWVLVLDADERLAQKDIEKIREIIKNEEYVGYYLIQRQYTNESGMTGWISSLNDTYPESKVAAGWFPNPILRLFKNDKRIRYYGKIHEIVDESVQKIGKISVTDIPIHHFGLLNISQGNRVDRNIELLKKELELGEKEKFFVYFQIATNFLSKEDYENAVENLKKSIEENQSFFPSLINLGGIYLKLDKLDEAEKYLRKALEIKQNPDIYNNLGILHVKKGELNKAVRKFEKAVELNSNSADAFYNLGLVYSELGKKDKAEIFLQRAKNLNPKYK
jgi:glycosyltransferase involved in cell wall biosynthesis